MSAASAASRPQASAGWISASRSRRRTSTATWTATAAASRAFSSPDTLQITNDGISAQAQPATTVTAAGYRDTDAAVARNALNTTASRAIARTLG